MNVLIGLTGSVATTVSYKLVAGILESGHLVEIVATQSAQYFLKGEKINFTYWTDLHEWPGYQYDKAKSIKHIELREWADILLIAPLTANTLAKMANGICDNLLTSIIRAWDRENPIVIAPAMNTKMWEHPLTQDHLAKLGAWYKLYIVPPVEKELACGEHGIGAMAEIQDIIARISAIEKGE